MTTEISVDKSNSSSTVIPKPISAYVRAKVLCRLMMVQGSWNYETMLGTGIAYAAEPLTELVSEDRRAATRSRQVKYFNSHPYLAGVAVGALARAELEEADPARILRFRQALTSPLGSMGDQIIWASWLPLSSLIALAAYGLGTGPVGTVLIFLLVYNSAHIVMRAWGLHIGLTRGLQVASALNAPILKKIPSIVGSLAALVAGFALPVLAHRLIAEHVAPRPWMLIAVAISAMGLGFLQPKVHGWQAALVVVVVFTIYAITL